MTRPRGPTYPLEEVKEAVRVGNWIPTFKASQTAAHIYCDRTDIEECVLALKERCFYKTMASEKKPGLMQDVYKTNHHGWPVYLKLQIDQDSWTVVISFKLDEDT